MSLIANQTKHELMKIVNVTTDQLNHVFSYSLSQIMVAG